jgi:hypothetical protein
MKQRRKITGVLHNFLNSFTSRYSDYDGYWIFGIIGYESEKSHVDLLNPALMGQSPAFVAASLFAAHSFREQMAKENLYMSYVREARLEITKLPEPRRGFVNGQSSTGHNFKFFVSVLSDYGTKYEHLLYVFVAPHDPKVESRSTRRIQFPLF